MKLIKAGRKQKGWAGEFECTGVGNGEGGCGAILLVEQDDLSTRILQHFDDITTYTTFTCSECGVQTDIKVPTKIQMATKKS